MKKNMATMKIKLMLLCGVFLFAACGEKKDAPKDGPASGEIDIAVDESFQLLVKAEQTAFQENYHFAKINLAFTPENEGIADLLNDKVRAAIVSRDLTSTEKEIFTREKITYRSFRFAADGIALLTNKTNTDTLIGLDQLKGLLSGTLQTWQKNRQSPVFGWPGCWPPVRGGRPQSARRCKTRPARRARRGCALGLVRS